MSDLDEMWQELARYQSYADRRQFGLAWHRMTTKRTMKAAQNAASWAATRAAGKFGAANSAAGAAFAAAMAKNLTDFAQDMSGSHVVDAAEWTEKGVRWKQLAIGNIRDAIEQEEP